MEKSINEIINAQSWNFKLTLIEKERERYSKQVDNAHRSLFERNKYVREWFFDFGDIEQDPKWLK